MWLVMISVGDVFMGFFVFVVKSFVLFFEFVCLIEFREFFCY